MGKPTNFHSFLDEIQKVSGALFLVRHFTDLNLILEKANKSRALGLVLTSGLSDQEKLILRNSTPQICIDQLKSFSSVELKEDFFYEFLVSPDQLATTDFSQFIKFKDQIFITLFNLQKNEINSVLKLKEMGFKIYFEFSHYNKLNLDSLSVSQIRNIIRQLTDLKIPVNPPPGRPIWDETIPQGLELEPLHPITFQNGDFSKIQHSVIIPTYNSKNFLVNVMNHLAHQDVPSETYEVIVIDDGSGDDSQNYLISHLSRNWPKLNLKYIYFPRPVLRQRGDSYFRPGLSRNLGAFHSAGEHLTFLDSDMLVPTDYLSSLKKDLESFDVIQNIRFHLHPHRSNEYIQFSNVQLAHDTFIEEEKYWGPFFACECWQSLPVFWKYTCTYSLTLSKNLFYQVGRFRTNFVSYGFEDTDLGYRLAQLGARFHLSKKHLLHLTPEKSQSEYRHSQIHRHYLLSKTAKKFFLNNLDPSIYDHLTVYMGGEYPLFRNLMAKTSNLLRGFL
jgi:glycosyltransferase involved in cell wall biosynthesis